MSQHSPFSNLEVRLRRIGATLGGSMRRELIGGALAILGLLLLIPVLRYSPGSQAAPPLLVLLAGWTAPLVAVATITVGGVLLLGPRAGYWSAEALVGVELFLLGLQVGTFVAGNERVDWNVRLDGSDGGLIGWAVGSLVMAALGRWLTLLVVVLLIAGRAAAAALYPAGLFARRSERPAARHVPFSGQVSLGAQYGRSAAAYTHIRGPACSRGHASTPPPSSLRSAQPPAGSKSAGKAKQGSGTHPHRAGACPGA